MTRINPSWEEINNFRNPLTPGERQLVSFLDDVLPDKWEIYVQPHFNGDIPDIVIFNPSIGMMIYEVKDWQAGAYHTEKKKISNKLINTEELINRYYVTDSRGTYHIPGPVSQVCRYRDNLVKQYVPYIGMKIYEDPYHLAAFKVGIYFHNMKTEQARELVQEDLTYCSIFGHDLLNFENLNLIAPDWNRLNTITLIPEWADEIRTWLKPPFHTLEQGQDLKLTTEQNLHTKPLPQKHQRLRGVAGSGKTLVIAQRAANLAQQGKKILVVTFNITLWHYIKDHVSRAKRKFNWGQIEFKHFHGFCKDFLNENDISWPIREDSMGNIILEEPALKKISETLQSGINKKIRVYDAILIDEGQDFKKSWYQLLCQFLSENDELLFVCDERQNLYDRDLSWIDSMTDTKFRGRWRELKESHRLPYPIIEKANEFADTFMGGEGIKPIPIEYNLLLKGLEPLLLWRNFNSKNGFIVSAWESFIYLHKNRKEHPQDIVILSPTHSEGMELVDFFNDKGILVNHVFVDGENPYHKKMSFWMGNPRLKMCTIHSFKGWELNNVILITPFDDQYQDGSLDRLLYTAITRSRKNLIVLNRNSRYYKYGKGWDNF